MGASGVGVFDDDTSCDLIDEAVESDAASFIQRVINYKAADYLEYDECQEVIVSATILDSMINGTTYEYDEGEFVEWIRKQSLSTVIEYKSDIIAALKVVLSDKSELKELWSENEEFYPDWVENIKRLISSLGS
ncbi:DUF4259 domain-containing protein [Shewanella sp. AC91-MNA-CIBAN-0169]|jgi:hypothetical protein|uniref:DUF4259 domain-containing protein n=1 Tax=Shewanella sp. AC91-MNA-CIBAN-0169 TaxID=3140466 RepID=UPI00332D6BE4